MEPKKIIEELERIDEELAQKDVPIHGRPIHAIMEFGRKFQISLPIVVAKHAHADPEYPKENEYITSTIHDWYETRYAELLKIDFSPGRTIVEVKGNIMVMKLPKVYGRTWVFWDLNKIGISGSQKVKLGPNIPPVELNIIDIIIGLTPSLAKTVNEHEAEQLVQWFILSMDVYNFLLQRKGSHFVEQALPDLNNSVDYIVGSKPSYGQSKWASLQACEKIMKAYIKDSGMPFSKTHKLKALANEAGFHSEKELKLLQNIQCSADTRYGEETVSKQDAINAHKSTISFIYWLSNK